MRKPIKRFSEEIIESLIGNNDHLILFNVIDELNSNSLISFDSLLDEIRKK